MYNCFWTHRICLTRCIRLSSAYLLNVPSTSICFLCQPWKQNTTSYILLKLSFFSSHLRAQDWHNYQSLYKAIVKLQWAYWECCHRKVCERSVYQCLAVRTKDGNSALTYWIDGKHFPSCQEAFSFWPSQTQLKMAPVSSPKDINLL